MIAVVLLVAILFAGNGLLIAHAAGPNGQGNGTGDHSNSGNGHNSGSGTNDHSSGPNNGDNSQGSGTGNQKSGTNDPPAQPLSLSIEGGVASAGTQHYIIQQSGHVIMASLDGSSLVTSQSTQLNYYLDATVVGTSVSGYANFMLTTHMTGGGTVEISGNGPIMSMSAAACLPKYDQPNSDGSCPSDDTSEVPAFFMGVVTLQVTIGTQQQSKSDVPMLFESAYLNPFGGPIVLGTADSFSTLLIMTTYNRATVDWSNVVDAGSVTGTLGSTTVSGNFMQVAQEHENLVTGMAQDKGIMTFSGMSTSSLDTSVMYVGRSYTPTSGSLDCSASLEFPSTPSICTNFGFESTGSFHTNNPGQQPFQISGSYQTTWMVPAFAFGGTISATVS